MTIAEKMCSLEDMVCPGTTACTGCNGELTLRTVMKILGKNTIVAIPTGCVGGIHTVGWADESGMKIPVFFPLLDNAAAMLSGIKRYYQRIGRDVNAVAFAGDGATCDAGFQALSGAAERGENIIYICYDNEGYMNTGFQRSSTTQKGSWTSTTPVGPKAVGKTSVKKDMPMIMTMHNIPYVATASPAYVPDLVRKVEKAMAVKNGLAYIHVYCSCSSGWGYEVERSIDVCRKLVQSRYAPIYEVENGKYTLSIDVKKPYSLKGFLLSLKKYQHLSDEQIADIQRDIDLRWERLHKMIQN